MNVHKNTEQNQSDSDMEIKDACITFYNFYMIYLRTETRYEPDEKGDLVSVKCSERTLYGDEALHYFFDRLKEKNLLTILDFMRKESGDYYMSVSTEPGGFDMKFGMSEANITWDEYEGKAWYELAEWPWKKREEKD